MGQDEKVVKTSPVAIKYLKKIVKAILYLIFGLISLNVLLYLLLLIPSVQQFVVNFAIKQIKPIIKTEVSINKVQIDLFNHINLQGIYVESQEKDTLLYACELDATINLFKLFNNKLEITSVTLDKAQINISKKTADAPFNFQFLIDAFASKDSTKNENPLQIAIENIRIKDSQVNYNIVSAERMPDKFDPSHIALKNFNAELDLSSIDVENLVVDIKSLSLHEQSGIQIDKLEAKIRSKGKDIFTEKLSLKLPHSNLDVDSLGFNTQSQEFRIIAHSVLSPKDLKSILPEIEQLKNDVQIHTKAHGKLPSLVIENIKLDYGEDLNLEAKASIEDVTKYEDSKLLLSIEKLSVKTKTIADLVRIGSPDFEMPEVLLPVDYLRLKASIEGSLKELKINADAWTNLGALQVNGKASSDKHFEQIKLSTDLKTQNFNLAPFAGKDVGLGKVSLFAHVNLLSNKQLSVETKGSIASLEYKLETLKDIKFEAQYSPLKMGATIDANLPIGKIWADASITQGKNPKVKLNLDMEDLYVDRFVENPDWVGLKASFSLDGDFNGATINTMQGTLGIDNLLITKDTVTYNPGNIVLEVGKTEELTKFIKISSSLLTARIVGKYDLIELPDELNNMLFAYLPKLFPLKKRVKYDNDFVFDITANNTEELSKILSLPISIIEPLTINGHVNTIDKILKAEVNIPLIDQDGILLKNTKLDLNNSDSGLNMEATSLIGLESTDYLLQLHVNAMSDTVSSQLHVKNERGNLNLVGDLNLLAHFEQMADGIDSYFQFIPSDLNINKLKLSLMPATIAVDKQKTSIQNFGFTVEEDGLRKKYISVDGNISHSEQDTLKINLSKARIGYILNMLEIGDVSAIADGEIRLTNLLDKPEFYTSNLQLEDITVYGDTLGNFNIKSKWDSPTNAILFDATLANQNIQSKFRGRVFPSKEEVDIQVDLDRLSLKWVQAMMPEILNKMDGSLSSHISVKGKIDEPVADGWLGFNDMTIGVNYTNVNYNISDTIKILPDKIGFRNLIIRDNNGNKATVSALVNHTNFKNTELQMNLDLDNFMILNTETRTDSLFYGKLMASGNVKIRGNKKDIDIKMNIKNGDNSKMTITIPDVAEANSYQGIVYINVPEEALEKTKKPEPTLFLPINMSLNLTLSPSINLGVVMNSSNPFSMQMQGAGPIKFDYNMLSNTMRMVGDYTLSGGTVKIKPQNIKTLEFKIVDGSKVSFTGLPTSANFNIKAYYAVNASLATLDQSFSSTRIPINCVLGISGNVNKMTLTYDISLPEATDDVKQKVKSLINTDEQKIRQFANLIVLNSFYSNTGGVYGGNMLGVLASSTLSGSLDNLFGHVLGKNWQIGTNIETSDGTFSDVDMSVTASTKLFNDRLKLNTNLGYRKDNTTENTFIGDFNVEYELTKSYKLKAYNHTNDQFYKQAPTTQGVGIIFTKESKMLKDLIQFFRKNKKEKSETKNTISVKQTKQTSESLDKSK